MSSDCLIHVFHRVFSAGNAAGRSAAEQHGPGVRGCGAGLDGLAAAGCVRRAHRLANHREPQEKRLGGGNTHPLRRRRRRSRWYRLRRYQWALGLLAVGAVATWAMRQTDKETVARTQTPPVTLSAPQQAKDAARPEPTPATPPPPATQPADAQADVQAEVQATVQAWAQAWSAGNAEAYLGMYSTLFKPAGTETRTQWERMRRERVTPAQQINIRLDDLKIDLSAEDQAEVLFVQHYAAKRFQDRSRKQLKLALENGHWKITSETVLPVLDHPVNSEH